MCDKCSFSRVYFYEAVHIVLIIKDNAGIHLQSPQLHVPFFPIFPAGCQDSFSLSKDRMSDSVDPSPPDNK